MSFTKGEIDRIGNEIRDNGGEVLADTLSNLQKYRTSYEQLIGEVFNKLLILSSQVRKDSIVTYRIKRIDSIVDKLYRYPSMRFSRMGDIGGCRCILKNNKQVYKLKSEIEKNFIVKGVPKDYIEAPKSDGYKSIHIFVTLPGESKTIEVQLRNQDDHNWSTLVEISDLLFNVRLKEYGDHPKLLRFHYLLSKIENVSFAEKEEIVELIIENSYFDRLSEVFARNYVSVRKQWEISVNKNSRFFLIIAAKNKIPKIEGFQSFSEAEDMYLKEYKKNENTNIVLTHLKSPNINHINIAYSNYILTYHTFMDDTYQMIEELTAYSMKNGETSRFKKYYNLYLSMVTNYIDNLKREIVAVNQVSNDNFNKYKRRNKRKNKKPKLAKDWSKDIIKQIKKINERTNRFKSTLRENMPSSLIKSFCINRIIKKANKGISGR